MKKMILKPGTRERVSLLIGVGAGFFIFIYEWIEIQFVEETNFLTIVLNAVIGGIIITVSAYVILHLYSKVREKEVRDESERKFKGVSSAAQDAIVMLDSRTNILFWNENAEKMFGYSEGEVLTKPLREVIEPTYAAKTQIVAESETATHERTLELNVKKKSGEEFPVELSMAGVKAGAEWNTVGVIRDITERKEIEAELKVAHGRIQQAQVKLYEAGAMDTVGRLASGVAHDVKSPLTVILQGAEYLSEIIKTNDETVPETLNYITDAVQQADSVLRGLMDVANTSGLSMKKDSINEVIESSLRLVRYQLNKNRIDVVKELDNGIPEFKIDKAKLEQALVNLFVNAIHAMSQKGTLTVRSIFKQPTVIIQIEDTGSGISEDVLDKIFDPFFTTKKEEGGTGLGLSNVKDIISKHNGKIDIRNRKEGGAAVTLEFKI